MTIIKKSTNDKCGGWYEEKGTPLHCGRECKLIQPLWRTVWSFLKKLKIELPYDLEIPVLGVYLEKTVNSKTCIHPNVYYGTIYNSQNMEATKMSTSRGRLKMWYVYTMEYYLAIKWDEIVPFAEKHCCFCSVVQSCLTLCDPMDYSMPGFPVLHCLPEFAQTHVYWVNDAVQPSLPLWASSPPALSFSQYQGLFQWVSSSYQVAKELEYSFV